MQSEGHETQAKKRWAIPFDHVSEGILAIPFGPAAEPLGCTPELIFAILRPKRFRPEAIPAQSPPPALAATARHGDSAERRTNYELR
jgi:hypothetical protein